MFADNNTVALFFTKWTHAMEVHRRQGLVLDQAELANLDSVSQLLTEVGIDMDGKTSLAAELTRLWATFYDDTWVWGGEHCPLRIARAFMWIADMCRCLVTPRMGWVLGELAGAYENTNQ